MNTKDLVLVKLDTARFALSEAKTIQETKKILDVATAAEILSKRQQLGEEAVKYATSIKVEALAQLGRMLQEMPKNKGNLLRGTKKEPRDNTPTLADMGLDKKTSKLAQDIASLPDKQIEAVKEGVLSLSKASKQVRKKERKNRIIQAANGVKTDFERYEELGWKLPIYNIWNYGVKDEAFGQKHFGNIPPQVVANLLYLYTKEDDLVYDPFVGGGMTLDVCKYFNRKCAGYDLTPVRGDIKQHDITNGLPDIKQPRLIFLDPPYWQQAKNKYSDKETDLGNVDLPNFLISLEKLMLKMVDYRGSIVAIIIGMNKRNDEWVDLPFKINKIMSPLAKFLNRVIVPYSTQVHGGAFVKQAQDKKELLYLYRDLLIYEL